MLADLPEEIGGLVIQPGTGVKSGQKNPGRGGVGGEVNGALGVPDGLPHHAHSGKKLAHGKIHRGFVDHSAVDEHGFDGIHITL